MAPMAHASEAPPNGAGATKQVAFSVTLKGWRSQLRWAMTQREEDPARVWLEVISIDERSKRALRDASDPDEVAALDDFRGRLEESIASLTEELGDENVAPLYSWLDLVRQRRRLSANIDLARAAVRQARSLRAPDGTRTPKTEEVASEQLVHARNVLEEWKAATPPLPPPEVLAVWEAEGGDALRDRMSRNPTSVARRGDRGRKALESLAGRAPGKHPWHGAKGERISIPVAGGATLLFALLSVVTESGALGVTAGLAFGVLVALLAFSFFVRRKERAEIALARDWIWHAKLYAERTDVAELEAGWLRALVDAFRALKAFDARATGQQLRELEAERPDLSSMVHEVARDTADTPASLAPTTG
jgi:hypothetical protein